MRPNERKRIGALVLAAALMIGTLANSIALAATDGGEARINYLAKEQLAPGVQYSEEDHVNYGGGSVGENSYEPHRVRFNHLSIDLSADGVRLSSARAEDTINARETIGEMAEREAAKGNNVLAAVNADPYDMDFGINCGIQVQNGNIVIGEPTIGYTTNSAPAFFVDGDGAHIDPLRAVFDITAGDYTGVVTSFNRNSFGSWYDDPLKLTSDTLRIYTSSITSDNTMTHYRQDTNPIPDNHAFALIRLDDFGGEVHAGTEYAGAVEQVYEDEGFPIPDDCIVLAGYAGDADGVRALTAGTEVSFSGNLYTGDYTTNADGRIDERGDLAQEVTTAVNGYHLLAKDGSVNTAMVENNGTDINARTVVGLTADGRVEILCANKPGSANINGALTTGTSFKEITQYMMEELGCVDVLNLDGGGSTEMVARRAGSDELTVVSYPSDGTSRLVSNSLLVISDAARTASVGQVVVDSDVTLYQGSGFAFSCRLTDRSGSAMSADGYSITWQAEKGAIDQNGVYTAPADAGEDTVTATVDGVSGSASVKVVGADAIASIRLSDTGTVALKQGDVHPFGLSAADTTGSSIVIDPALAEWTLDGDVGTLNAGGCLTVTAASGEGTVSCVFLEQSYSVPLVVGLEEQIIDDFEGGAHRASAYEISSRYIYPSHSTYWGGDSTQNMVGVETDRSKVKSGDQSLYFVYDTTDWTRATNGTLSLYPFWDDTSVGYGQAEGWTEEDRAAMEEQYTAKAMPRKFGLWVYSGDENGDGTSDNYDCMSTCYFKIGYGTPGVRSGSIKITPTEHIDWVGWKWLEFDIPQDWEMPIVFNYLMVSNINKALPVAQNYRTTLLFDDLKYIYTGEAQDNDGPVFSGTAPGSGGIYTDQFTFSTTIADAANAVDAGSISVTVNGEPFGGYTYDEATGKLTFALTGLTDGESLRVIVKAKDTKGNESVPYIDNFYTVDLTEDAQAPVISNVTPTHSATVRIPSPRIGFYLTDAKSGVDPESVRVTLDGKAVPAYYDSGSGWGYAQPEFSLAAGNYALSIAASDRQGNAMTPYTDTLDLQPIPQPADPDNYSVGVIPDTQGNAYSAKIFSRAARQDTDFIIHLGDIVDGTGEEEYIAGKDYLESTGKPYLTIPGNHEGGAMNLDYYTQYFGSPTYAFDYGSTRFIALNSAYRQSISDTDPTQYHYLEQMLQGSKADHVVVYNHVITRDPYYTEHNMTAEEAARFEGVLAAYKAAHPKVTVTVIFGHLHTLATWEVGGVEYIIGGNAAGKGYVTADEGNMLGSGIIEVKDGVFRYKYEPMPSKIYIQNAAMAGSSLTAMEGAEVQLNLYGDFHEAAAVSSASVSYVTRMDDDGLVDIVWSSSDPTVAEVSDTGVVTVNAAGGQAVISAACGGKTSSVTVYAADQSNLQVSKLELFLPERVTAGQIVVPTAVATDPYGSRVALKLTGAMLRIEPVHVMTIRDDGRLTANFAGDVTVTVAFGEKTAQAAIRIQSRASSGSPTAYSITDETGKTANGSIGVDRSSASAGTEVTVTPKPDAGYQVAAVTVKDAGGNPVFTTKNSDGTYAFVMPAGNVTVEATFVKSDTQAPFSDVGENAYCYDAVLWARDEGITAGKTGTTFAPDEPCTRAQVMAFLWRALGSPEPAAEKSVFSDVADAGSYYYKAVAWAAEQGVTTGTATATFSPGAPVTRSQFVTFLWRCAGKPAADGGNPFADVAGGAYDSGAILWAAEQGVTTGTTPTTFSPADVCTRGQAVTFLYRYLAS